MSGSIPVSRFLFKQDWKVLSEVMRISPLAGEDFMTSTELVTYLGTEPVSLVISALFDKSDLVQIATFMKQQKALKGCAFKIVVVNFSGQKAFEKAIQKLGILDIVEPNVNTKALKFKIDFWLKALNAQVKKNSAAEMTTKSTKGSDHKGDEKKLLDQAQWQPAMECEDDIWLIKNETSDCKKVLGKWLVKMMGPSPYVGQWVELENKPNIWRFEIKAESKETFLPEQGSWYFSGEQKPEFQWKENVWMITGSSFELFHRTIKNEHQSRLKLKDKVLTVTKNSEFAKTKEQDIIDSFDKELVFKKEVQSEAEADVLENENELAANLEGKGKTDNIENKNLSGEASGTDALGGPLQGRTKGQGDIGVDPLEQKGNNGGHENSHWDGKNSKEDPLGGHMDAPAPDKHREGAELGLENKNQTHQTKYKGHNEAEQFEANDKKNNQYKGGPVDDLGGHMDAPAPDKHREGAELGLENKNQTHQTKYKGHNEAEQFDANDKKNNQYGGKSDFQEKALEDLKSPSLGKHNEGQQLSQDAGDQEHQTHYKGRNLHEKLNEQEKKSKEGQEEHKAKDKDALDGKSHTDKLASHYKSGSGANKNQDSNKNNESEESEGSLQARPKREKSGPGQQAERDREGDLDNLNDSPSGKNSTDKIDGHYRSHAKGEKEEHDSLDEESNDVADINKARERVKKEKAARGEAVDEHGVERESSAQKGRSTGATEDDLFDGESKARVKRPKNSIQETFDDSSEELSDANDLAAARPLDDSAGPLKAREGKSKADRDVLNNEHADKVVSIAEARQDKQSVATVGQDLPEDLKKACETATLECFISVDGHKVECGLQDYFDDTFIFSSEKSGIQNDSTVKIDMKFDYLGKTTKVSVDGKISSVDVDSDGQEQLTVDLNQDCRLKIDNFMKVYQTRQQNVNVFIKAVKGY